MAISSDTRDDELQISGLSVSGAGVGLHACKGITDEQKLVLSLHDQPLAK
jgi:hypothetical protein